MFQLLLTHSELMDENFNWLMDLDLKSAQSIDTEDKYEDFVSLLVGSHYITFKTPFYNPLKQILQTKESAIKNSNLTDLQKLPEDSVGFDDIRGKSLGRIEDILFWNDPQHHLYENLKKFEHTIVTGDYGVGKTVIALAFADYCCSHPEVKEVHFISALDYEAENHNTNKITEDVFDVIMKDRLSGNEKLKFVSLAMLRQNFEETVKESKNDSKKGKRERQLKRRELWTDRLLSDYLYALENKKKIVVIIDEFHLNWRFKEDLKKGKTPEMIEALHKLKNADTFKMALIVLSTSSLLDKNKTDLQPETLQSLLLDRIGFKHVELSHIMRNSQAVSNATRVDSINNYRNDVLIEETIASGSVSTVQGIKPTCIIFPHIKKDKTVQYEVMAKCIKMYFEKYISKVSGTQRKNPENKAVSLSIAILCESGVSSKALKEETDRIMDMSSFLFDHGISMFNSDGQKKNVPGEYYNVEKEFVEAQKRDVLSWSRHGGVLITTTQQFRGCEADVAIVVGSGWTLRTRGHRNGLTRGVAHLCFITGNMSVQETILEHFEVIPYDDTKPIFRIPR